MTSKLKNNKEFQENNPECNLKPGDYVKIGVEDNDQIEHMWFKVLSVDGNKIIGQLDNDPVLISNLIFGDEYGFVYKNRELLMSQTCGKCFNAMFPDDDLDESFRIIDEANGDVG